MSVFDTGGWDELDVGILDDESRIDQFIVTDESMATHRRYRNRQTGEILIDRI